MLRIQITFYKVDAYRYAKKMIFQYLRNEFGAFFE